MKFRTLIAGELTMIAALSSAQEMAPGDSVAVVGLADSLRAVTPDSLLLPSEPLSSVIFLPAIFAGYDPEVAAEVSHIAEPDTITPQWLQRQIVARRRSRVLSQRQTVNEPQNVRYNLALLPPPPEEYVFMAEPERVLNAFNQVAAPEVTPVVAAVNVERQDWLNKLDILLQFSQAYVSPNWYQGGNSSLNLVSDFNYDTKLNTKFYPNLLFENHFQWKTVLAATQDDPYRKYSLTENRFQINSTFGYRAAHNWYYTFNGVFKTPIFNGYKIGTNERTASFLSPGELNIGLGMTYGHTSSNGNFTLGITISPLSYNLKTVIDSRVDETVHGLELGHKTKNSYGSSAEIKWTWKMGYNVKWESRIFGFSNYEYFQGDWQNRFEFTINRFLSTTLNVDVRYDSSVPPMGSWKRWQLREQISLGFSYTFSH